jgi:hypothetical protein
MNLVESAVERPIDAGDKKKAKKEGAHLTLETFVLYKPNTDGRSYEFFPVPAAVRQSGGRTIVTVGNIPFPAGVPHPANAITALYGFRDALEEIQRQLKFARESNMRNIKVTFKLQVRDIVMGTTDLEKLGSTDFLNLRRLQSDLANIIVDGVNERLAQEAPAGVRIETYNRITDACHRPDLLCDVIRSEKIFSHIKAVAYMIPDSEGSKRGRQVCTVFTDAFEDVGYRGDMPFDIELPRFKKT